MNGGRRRNEERKTAGYARAELMVVSHAESEVETAIRRGRPGQGAGERIQSQTRRQSAGDDVPIVRREAAGRDERVGIRHTHGAARGRVEREQGERVKGR